MRVEPVESHRAESAPHSKRSMRAMAASAGALLVLSACGGSGTSTTDPPSPTPTGDATPTPTSSPAPTYDYYEDEVITLILVSSVGGAVDVTGRFWGEWLARYLEGNPPIVYEYSPGGSTISAGNHYDHNVDRDGLTLYLGGPTPHSAWRFGVSGATYDMSGWEPLIANPGGNVVYADPSSGIESLDDLVNGTHDPLYYAGQVPSGGDLSKVWAFHVLGVDVEVTWGYEGRGAGRIALEQGEANVDVQSAPAYAASVHDDVVAGLAIPLFTTGQVVGASLERDPYWPDLPHVGEVYEMMHGEPPSGELWDAYLLQAAITNDLGRTMYVHADAPQEAIETLRHAIEQMVADPEFISQSEEVVGPYQPNTGAALREMVRAVLVDIDPSLIDFIVDFVAEVYDTDLRES